MGVCARVLFDVRRKMEWEERVEEDVLSHSDSYDSRAGLVSSSAVLSCDGCDEGSGDDGETHFDRVVCLADSFKEIGYKAKRVVEDGMESCCKGM
jgi:hypothetical protein